MGGFRAQVRSSDEGWTYRVVNEDNSFTSESRSSYPTRDEAAAAGRESADALTEWGHRLDRELAESRWHDA